MASSNILNKGIKLPKPKVPSSLVIPLTRILLLTYSLLSLIYIGFFFYHWFGFGRKVYVIERVNQLILSPIVIPIGLLLLFGIVQDIYATIIINMNRKKAWEHSFIGTIITTILLALFMRNDLEYYLYENNIRALVIPSFWLLLTILLFIGITKLKNEKNDKTLIFETKSTIPKNYLLKDKLINFFLGFMTTFILWYATYYFHGSTIILNYILPTIFLTIIFLFGGIRRHGWGWFILGMPSGLAAYFLAMMILYKFKLMAF